MSGRLVTKHGSLKTTSGDGSYVLRFNPAADVRWTALIISWMRYPGGQPQDTGSFAGEWSIVVDNVAVFVWRWNGVDWAPKTLIIPWGDGLMFSGNQSLSVVLTDNADQSVASACAVGHRI